MKALILQAVAYIVSLAANTKALHQAIDEKDAKLNEQASVIADQSNVIANLRAQIAVDAIDDEELEKAAKNAIEARDAAQAAADAASAKTVELQATLDDLNIAGEELRKAINDEPKAPNVDQSFSVVLDTPAADSAPAADAETATETAPEAAANAEPSADLTKPTDGETAAE